MANSSSTFWSTVARKFFLALTGLALFIFVCGHLAGNLLLFVGPDAFNTYSHKLISMGPLLYVVEILLVAVFLIHLGTGIFTAWKNRQARPDRYAVQASRGDPSRMTLSSKTMIWTGLVIGVFVVIHVITFKYGPGMAEGYVATIEGEQVRDLYRLVAETFQSEGYVVWYVAAMVLLGLHLRHGFWSAVQSIGAYHPKATGWIYAFGVCAAIVLAVGFLVIPLWFYFFGGTAS